MFTVSIKLKATNIQTILNKEVIVITADSRYSYCSFCTGITFLLFLLSVRFVGWQGFRWRFRWMLSAIWRRVFIPTYSLPFFFICMPFTDRCGSGARAGCLTRRLVVRCSLPPFRRPKCPWARYCTPNVPWLLCRQCMNDVWQRKSCTYMHCMCVWLGECQNCTVKCFEWSWRWKAL